MRCSRAVFNNYSANEQLAWSIQANKLNSLPILGLYPQWPPQLQGQRIDNVWKVHLYSNMVYCLRLIAYSLCHHKIRRNQSIQEKPKWVGCGKQLDQLGTHIFLTKLVVALLLKAELFSHVGGIGVV